MTRVGVLLSGCGYLDGSEIHEAVLTLLALDRLGATAVCFAPDVAQSAVMDHAKKKATKEKRNVLVEAARIARSQVADVATAKAEELDALVLPGGFGAAKNLCDFAKGGADYSIEPETARFLKEMHGAKKPIAALCIAPAILAKVLGREHVKLTIGNEKDTAARLERTGSKHQVARIDEIVIDEKNRVVTTPCYMYDARIGEVWGGIEQAVNALLELL